MLTSSVKSSPENHSRAAFPKILFTASAVVAAGYLVRGGWKKIAGIFGVQTEDSAHFLTELRELEFEIRLYSAHGVAEITVAGEHDAAITEGFLALEEYLSGGNSAGVKMPMTLPVSETRVATGWQLSFVLPSNLDLAALPRALDPHIRVFAVPPRRAALLEFKGRADEEQFSQETIRLENWIRNRHLVRKSGPVLNLYDHPFTVPFLRKNEVQIEIE